jgi:hypothetical protein
MFQVLSDLAILFLTQEFLLFIESPTKESVLPEVLPVNKIELAKLYMEEYRSLCLILSLIAIKLPMETLNERYYMWVCEYQLKMKGANEYLMYKKQTRITSATNKTVSSGKMLSVYNSDTNKQWVFLW